MTKKWLSFVIAGFTLAGCATLTIVPPEVTLVSLEFTDLTMFETTGEFTVRMANENPDPLRISGAVFRLYLNGVKVGKALSSESVEIPRLATATQKALLHVDNVALIGRLTALLNEPEVDYQIKTRLYVESSYGTRRVNLQNSGTFSWSQDQAEAHGEWQVDG